MRRRGCFAPSAKSRKLAYYKRQDYGAGSDPARRSGSRTSAGAEFSTRRRLTNLPHKDSSETFPLAPGPREAFP
jgi:hypothetical protein